MEDDTLKDLSYSIMKNGLDASSARQKAISSNIANVTKSAEFISNPNWKRLWINPVIAW